MISNQARSDEPKAGTAPQVYAVRGIVKKIATDQRKAVIKHEATPNYMPAMVMELTLRVPRDLDAIKVGDSISFRLVANEEDHWIDTLRLIATSPAQASEGPTKEMLVELKP